MSVYSQFFPSQVQGGSIVACELLVIGGGGFVNDLTTVNNNDSAHGGAGGGEFVSISGLPVLRGQTISVVVGGSGSQSSFSDIVAQPGQRGGDIAGDNLGVTSGGSGGGAASGRSFGTVPSYTPVTDNTRIITSNGTVTYSESKARFNGGDDNGGSGASGGGGGAGGLGGTTTDNSSGGAAGVGLSTSITGASVTYAAGGAGAPVNANTNGVNGTANTGNGGSGCSRITAGTATGSQGGSGIVIIAYPDTYPTPSAITGTYTQPTRSGWRVYRFTGSGTITL